MPHQFTKKCCHTNQVILGDDNITPMCYHVNVRQLDQKTKQEFAMIYYTEIDSIAAFNPAKTLKEYTNKDNSKSLSIEETGIFQIRITDINTDITFCINATRYKNNIQLKIEESNVVLLTYKNSTSNLTLEVINNCDIFVVLPEHDNLFRYIALENNNKQTITSGHLYVQLPTNKAALCKIGSDKQVKLEYKNDKLYVNNQTPWSSLYTDTTTINECTIQDDMSSKILWSLAALSCIIGGIYLLTLPVSLLTTTLSISLFIVGLACISALFMRSKPIKAIDNNTVSPSSKPIEEIDNYTVSPSSKPITVSPSSKPIEENGTPLPLCI